MEIKYQLNPQYMATYQAAIRPRLNALRKGWLASGPVRALLFAALAFGLLLAGDALATIFTGGLLDGLSTMYGLVCGGALVLAAAWIDYGEMRGKMMKPDGLMYSSHTLRVTDDGLEFGNAKYEGRYRWVAFDEVTRLKDMFVLWIEPGMGFIVPQAAFASPDEAKAFFDNAREKIAAAKAA